MIYNHMPTQRELRTGTNWTAEEAENSRLIADNKERLATMRRNGGVPPMATPNDMPKQRNSADRPYVVRVIPDRGRLSNKQAEYLRSVEAAAERTLNTWPNGVQDHDVDTSYGPNGTEVSYSIRHGRHEILVDFRPWNEAKRNAKRAKRMDGHRAENHARRAAEMGSAELPADYRDQMAAARARMSGTDSLRMAELRREAAHGSELARQMLYEYETGH